MLQVVAHSWKVFWNWYTTGTCFITSSWKIRSAAAFAGLCIGVTLMSILLHAIGFCARFYDRRLVRQHQADAVELATKMAHGAGMSDSLTAESAHNISPMAVFRPNLLQQIIRALIRTAQFALAYWIVLMAIYYNGFVIVCIGAGVFVGTYIFQWERMGGPHGSIPGGHADLTACC